MDDAGHGAVRDALEAWTADAVWVAREQLRIEREMEAGERACGDWRWKGARPRPASGDGEFEFPDVVF